jgi:hypothetical protein
MGYIIAAASSAGQVTIGQAFRHIWQGFKAIPVTVYHLIVNHNAASVLQILYFIGVLLLAVVVAYIIRLIAS